jgi:hypothetical protein
VLLGNKQRMLEIYVDRVGVMPGDLLVSYWLETWWNKKKNSPIESPLLFYHFPKFIHYSKALKRSLVPYKHFQMVENTV